MSSEDFPLSSKKFIAYMIAELTWKAVILVILLRFEPASMSRTMLVMVVVVAGFIEAGYIGGQAWLDRYVRVAQAAASQNGMAQPKKQKK